MTYHQYRLRRTYKKDVKVGEGEPSKEEVERVVCRFQHQAEFAGQTVVGPPYLADINQRPYLSSVDSTW